MSLETQRIKRLHSLRHSGCQTVSLSSLRDTCFSVISFQGPILFSLCSQAGRRLPEEMIIELLGGRSLKVESGFIWEESQKVLV
jgi:hypothetical protein